VSSVDLEVTQPALYFGDAPGGDEWIYIGALFPVELARVIGAGHFTIAAADATVIVHHHQAV
jgi:hypothetical protein